MERLNPHDLAPPLEGGDHGHSEPLLDLVAEAINSDPDFDDPGVNNPSAWTLAGRVLDALADHGYRPKHLAPPLHNIDADWIGECPACAEDFVAWTQEHPHPPTYAARWDPAIVRGDIREFAVMTEAEVRVAYGFPQRRRIGQRSDGSPIYAVPTPTPSRPFIVRGPKAVLDEVRFHDLITGDVRPLTDDEMDPWPGDGPAEWRGNVEVDAHDLRSLIDWVEDVHSKGDPICEVAARLLEALGAAGPEGGSEP